MTDTLAVPKGLLQILFDTAVNSMDFGSGFLDDEEVAALRQAAEIPGCRSDGSDALRISPTRCAPVRRTRCKWCGRLESEEIHVAADG